MCRLCIFYLLNVRYCSSGVGSAGGDVRGVREGRGQRHHAHQLADAAGLRAYHHRRAARPPRVRANVLALAPRPLIVAGCVRSDFSTAVRASDGATVSHKTRQQVEGEFAAADAVVFELPGQLEVADAIILRP